MKKRRRCKPEFRAGGVPHHQTGALKYVITIEALKEGWDCSFAYIFCSVSRIQSATAVEQLLGRVLRMPFAERRKEQALNRSYAHVSEPSFSQAANALRDKLVAMGFDEDEAALNIEKEIHENAQGTLDDEYGGIFGAGTNPKPSITETVQKPIDLSTLTKEDQSAVSVKEVEGGKYEVTVEGYISEEALSVISSSVPEPQKKEFTKRAKVFRKEIEKELSPAARRVPFIFPRMVTEIQGELEFADHEIFDEYHDWSLLDYPTKLTKEEFNIVEEANSFEIDLDGRKLAISFASQDEQLSMDIEVTGWTENNLALALDKLITDARFGQSERLKWCLNHVHHLVKERDIPLSSLWRAKFVLGRKLVEQIKKLKTIESKKSYQKCLFAPEAKATISFEHSFEFKEHMYDGQKPYRGRFKFKKHFLDPVPEIDGKDTGEETRCAMELEAHPQVKHWLRNIANHTASFRLPLAQGWTYPDFVAELTDGRLLIVEYKGAHLLNDDAREKRLIGELWEKKMNGKGLYIMAVKDDHGRGVKEQLMDKIGG